MRLYLVQHGEAVAETADPDRPLTERGREDIRRLAAFLAESGVQVGRVVHSGKLRASDTAAILTEAIGAGATVEVMEKGLRPKDSPVYVAEAADAWREDTLVVGHQPVMSRLVSRLVLNVEQPTIVDFTPGTLVGLLRRPATGARFIACMIPPELLRH
jgi:phosphohistidine phosphatase